MLNYGIAAERIRESRRTIVEGTGLTTLDLWIVSE